MKLQFSTKTLLLATTWVAIALFGVLAQVSIYESMHQGPLIHQTRHPDRYDLFRAAFYSAKGYSPFWIPILFATYALGRRRISLPATIAFAACESIAIIVEAYP